MKQRKGYNWHGKPTWASKEHEREMAYLRTEPTAKQKKFYTFLKLTLKEHGVEVPLFRHALMTRADYSEYISELVQLCKDNGIPVHENGKKFDRVTVVEADGSVHEKMVERKEDKPCST